MASLQHPPRIVTPPHESFQGSPPTVRRAKSVVPKQVQAVLRAFKNHQNGGPVEQPVEVYRLTPENYRYLLGEVKRDTPLAAYLKDKIRYDFDPSQNILSIRMPTVVHGSFTILLAKEFSKELQQVGEKNKQTHSFVEKVRQIAGRLKLHGKDGDIIRREPDLRFQHKDAGWPGVVIEVGYSQTKKSLDRLAETYILGSYGGIKTVVGINLAYKGKAAFITTWQLKTSVGSDGEQEMEVQIIVDNQPFRDIEGKLVETPSANLTISTKDLIPDDDGNGIPDIPLVIPAQILYELLNKAEELEELDSRKLGSPRLAKRMWRESSPIDEITNSDEEKVLTEEKREEKKMHKLEKSYA